MFAQVLDNRRSVLLRQQGEVTDPVRIVPAAQVKRLFLGEVQRIQMHAQWKPLAPLNGLHDDLALIRARLHVHRMEGQPHLPGHARGHGDRIPIVLDRNLRQGRRHRHPSPSVGPGHLVNGHILGIVAAGQPAQAERHLHRLVTAVAHIECRGAVLLAHQVHLDGQFRRRGRRAYERQRIPQIRAPECEQLQAFGAPEPRLRAQHPFVPRVQRQHRLEIIPEGRGRPQLLFYRRQFAENLISRLQRNILLHRRLSQGLNVPHQARPDPFLDCEPARVRLQVQHGRPRQRLIHPLRLSRPNLDLVHEGIRLVPHD